MSMTWGNGHGHVCAALASSSAPHNLMTGGGAWDNAKKMHRGRRCTAAEGSRRARRVDDGRHGRRSLQGHRRPGDQPDDQDHEHRGDPDHPADRLDPHLIQAVWEAPATRCLPRCRARCAPPPRHPRRWRRPRRCSSSPQFVRAPHGRGDEERRWPGEARPARSRFPTARSGCRG